MHDFDFLFGSWDVRNERLKVRLAGSTEWEGFDATSECRPVLGGVGNVDEMVTAWGGGFHGMSLRLYDARAKTWSIYWASTRLAVLDPPVVGAFEAGVGTFHGRDAHEGTPVLVRFRWSDITPTAALWQQAFSPDDGATWETNWRMRFTRSH